MEVIAGDCTDNGLPEESFDSVATFTMLHHLPNQAAQFATLREASRVLRPGGVLVGSDSLASVDLHHFHAADTYNPVDPARLLVWLQAVGFSPVQITVGENVRFVAHKPPGGKSGGRGGRA